ncbi:acylphosphatase [Vibrio xiamenensis]|uniref:Acylphosphatase n=1 Tax=Vibrio xiamenensis TaxID=861298 RepID=A0A1G7YG48_9VIBR|nr:acylphosphatase [Vibrio xiamenensis]SDG95265.1 acylphosphatase [Vibrio xiamenensis]
MDIKSEKFQVSGLVQGVGFRYQTCHQGLKFGLVGYAKNLNNGDVEVVVSGDPKNVELFAEWIKTGPRNAWVENVVRESLTPTRFDGFEIL